MSDNFIEVVGFQLEKVHTGVISWLLDSKNSIVPIDDKTLILSRLLSKDLNADDLTEITSIQEYAFGRRIRIDMVVKMVNKKGDTSWLLIECKTDSDVNTNQLQQSQKAFLERFPTDDCACFVLSLGASQFTYQHMIGKIKELKYNVLDVTQTRRIFSDLSIKGNNKIYDDWCDALKKEEERCSTIDQVILGMKDPWDERFKASGYRLGFPVFYTFYGKLRESLDQGPFKNWAIYSGSNNPVMNWQNGWLEKGSGEESIVLYWEFNWNSLTLKAELGNKSYDRWGRMKQEITRLCSASQVKGRSTVDRRGANVTAYKWDFDFCQDPVPQIATKTNTILENLHEQLKHIP